MKSNYFLRVFSLLALLISLVPAPGAIALADPPPADMFQLPWDLGIAWVAIDGLDNGTRRPLNSSHHFSVGGAIDFAPHNNMRLGEDTSRFWVAAAASGTVVGKSFCHVRIDHGNGWSTEYQFLANIQVNVGDAVTRNQRLGILADGVRQKFCPGSKEPNVPHVHFMLRPSLRDATLAGWEVNYLPVLSKTTFRKNGQTIGLFQPLLNTFDQIQIVSRGPITWDTLHSGTVDSFRYERWTLTLDELTPFTLTAAPTSSGLTPLILLLDANGNEILRSSGTLTSTQSAGNYFVQIQPQVGSGSYTLLAQRNDLPAGPFVSTTVSLASVNVGQAATATVRLNNVPAEGYTSTEFTCSYSSTVAQVSDIVVADLFGADPAVAISEPQNGSFIVAVAGSKGKKAMADGTAFTFSLTGSQVGQTAVECKARVSQGDNVLTAIDFVPGSLTVLGNTATPTLSTPVVPPTTPIESQVPTVTHSPTPGASPTSSFTPVPPTPTVLPSVCDKAEFIADITIPNGTVVSPGATFTKTWRLKNIGPCDWTRSYRLVFFSGEPMGAVFSFSLPTNVPSGATVDISLNMTAPNAPGRYRGYWMFMNADGKNFGIGPDGNEPWFVDIMVSGATPPPSLTPTFPPSSPTPTPTVPGSDWLTFTNTTYGFQFNYPKESQIVSNGNDNSTRIHLPFAQGTNLTQKYLQMTVVKNVNPCRSLLASSSIPQTSETVMINGVTFLKEVGEDGTAGHIHTWMAYSTTRGNACVSLDFVLQATNPGVFTTPLPSYDEAVEAAVFEQIMSTFDWLTSELTATPTATQATPDGSATLTPVSPTPGPGEEGFIAGKVIASKLVIVNVYDMNNNLIVSTETTTEGEFLVPALPGTYTVVATASGFLSSQGIATVTAGNTTTTMPTISLLAGDIDGNDVIDQFDALTIGMSYNTATPPEADLNNDGVINVLDLELLADNYRKTAPQAWN